MKKNNNEIELSKAVRSLIEQKLGKSFKAKEIANSLKLSDERYLELRQVLRHLVEQGEIIRIKKNRFSSIKSVANIVGLLRVNSQGYGFVIRDEGGDDVFVSSKNMGNALHLDHVSVRLFAEVKGQKPEGQVVDILKRGRNRIVGTFHIGRGYTYVTPDDIKIQIDIIINDPESSGALDGQKVVVAIDYWPERHLNPEGRIVEVLGFADELGVDVLSIVHAFELPTTFPKAVLEESETLSDVIATEEYKRRMDLRDWLVFTIDPEDAKDFDDAVSLQIVDDGCYRLGVHIADVSHYVKQKGIIDQEAQMRGTSIYLVDRVLPMLPERISNELCSLAQGKDKLCFSVIMDMASNGELMQYRLHESIIHSSKRFTYEEAQALIESDENNELANNLRQMLQLSRKLIARRLRRGSINFDSLEVKVIMDETGHPIALKRRERLDTHRLIEEFMLLANETVAKHVGFKLAELKKKSLPFVYRIHEKPERANITSLLGLAKTFAFEFEPPKRITPYYFQRISQAFAQHPASTVLQDALLRTMMKARYSTQNCGHFGLAYQYYTHFTSPIRRYPDLLVHRLLKAYSQETMGNIFRVAEIGKKVVNLEIEQDVLEILPNGINKIDLDLEEQCKAATNAEIRAQEAERASVKMKQTEFMDAHLGEIFDGFICRIVPFGIFVHLPEFLLDGLVHISNLKDDYYVFEEDSHRLLGRTTGNIYRLGDHVRVRVARVDRNERLIDFSLICKLQPDGSIKNESQKKGILAKKQESRKKKRR